MLIWRGWGIGVLILGVLVNVAVQALIGMAMGDDNYPRTHSWVMLLSMEVAAVCVWIAGVKLESRPGQVVIDKASGQEFELKSKHDLFWIPFKYWAFAFAIMGVVFAFGGKS